MPKLNDTQILLLAHAVTQDAGLYPLPEPLTKSGAVVARTVKAIEQLIDRGLVEERQTSTADQITHTESDIGYGKFITSAGMQAIGIEVGGAAAAGSGADAALPAPTDNVARQSKAATVLDLMRREEGATMEELIAATGWLPHTTRAALTGLRKKGHDIQRGKRDDKTCYSIASAA